MATKTIYGQVGGYGCSADCSMIEPGFECPVPGMPCIPLPELGSDVEYKNCPYNMRI